MANQDENKEGIGGMINPTNTNQWRGNTRDGKPR